MRPGQHAAGDGSFGRSAGTAAGRGLVLLAVAVLIGVVLLNVVDDEPPGHEITAGNRTADNGAVGEDDTDDEAPPTTLGTRPPGEVKVLVANASGVGGAAGRITSVIAEKGYATGNATNATRRVEDPVIYFADGYQREAAQLAVELGLDVSIVQAMPATPPVPDLQQAHVLVLVDEDLAKGQSPTTTAAATPTTAAG